MGIATISVRVPAEIKSELKHFERDEKLTQTSEAARKVLMIGLEKWRKERALRLFEAGEVSFSKAAEIAKITVWEFAELVKDKKITWLRNKEMIHKDISAAR